MHICQKHKIGEWNTFFFFCEVYDLQQEELFKIRTVKKIKTKKRKNGAFALCYVEIGGSLKGWNASALSDGSCNFVSGQI